MSSFSDTALNASGFEGFCSVAALRADRCAAVPKTPGVYVVRHRGSCDPGFLERGTGGHFKAKDPNVPIAFLANRWNPRSAVAYIGKAGGPASTSHLKKRLDQYICFGGGAAIGHWGGRLIWQLRDPEVLEVSWRTFPDAAALETALLALHHAEFGTLPFANLRR